MMRLFVFLLLLGVAPAQSVTSVEQYGPVTAVDVYAGLGTNITNTNAWEYQAAQAAHITWGRFDCSWANTEIQTMPANTSGGYALSSGCVTGLSNSATYGVHPMLDALFNPPFTAIATGTVTSNVSIGATSVPITVATGSLSGVVNGQTCLQLASGEIAAKYGYCGTLLLSASGTTLNLASAVTEALTAGTALTVNLLLYPPIVIAPNTNYRANASVLAYAGYAMYLANQISGSGITGRVELWNEPPWPDECWDGGAARCYDTPPPNSNLVAGLAIEIPGYVSTLTPPTGVKWNSGYTDIGADGALFDPSHIPFFPYTQTILKNVAGESMHPYGNNPEDQAWIPACVREYQDYSDVEMYCSPVGGNVSSNWKYQASFNLLAYTYGGLQQNITETGLNIGTNLQKTRFDMRQFLTFQGSGVSPVMFFRLYDNSGSGYSWFASQGNPLPVYTAFQNMMSDLSAIAYSPVLPYAPCMMPRVSSYTGYYPLATVMLVGSTPGAVSNSIMFYTWQRSYSAGAWTSLASPSPVNASVVIPTGMAVTYIKDVVTSTTVSYTVSGQTVTYPVADDPIEILLSPSGTAVLTCT